MDGASLGGQSHLGGLVDGGTGVVSAGNDLHRGSRVNAMSSSQHPSVANDGATTKAGVVDDQSHLVRELVARGDASSNNPGFG